MVYPYIVLGYLKMIDFPNRDSSVTSNGTISTFEAASLKRSEGTVDTSSERLMTGTPDLDIGSCFLLELHPNNTNTPISNKDMCFIATIELRFIVCA